MWTFLKPQQQAELDNEQAKQLEIAAAWAEHDGEIELAQCYAESAAILRSRAANLTDVDVSAGEVLGVA